jgi:hypothetical protein
MDSKGSWTVVLKRKYGGPSSDDHLNFPFLTAFEFPRVLHLDCPNTPVVTVSNVKFSRRSVIARNFYTNIGFPWNFSRPMLLY